MPLLQPKLPKKKSARVKRAGVAFALSVTLAALYGGGNASAVPVAPTPRPSATANATATPSNELPYNGSLLFVLDGTISSTSSKKNDEVPAHLRDPLIIAGKTVAPAGTKTNVRVLDVQAAHSGDVYGFVDIFFEPMQLPDGQRLPLRAPVTRLTVNVTAGHESTVGVEDQVADIFIPYAPLWQIFRKGRNLTLGPGAELRARSMAEVRLSADGTVNVATPPPLPVTIARPHSAFSPLPMITPAGFQMPSAKPKPTPTATATATPAASATP